MILSNGQSVTTDSQGMYSIPSVNPGSVTISVDPATLPSGYTLSDEGRFYGQSWSRLLRTPLGGGSMLRQDFPLAPLSSAARAAGPPAAASGSRPPVPAAPASPAAPGGNGAVVKLEVLPERTSADADGRTITTVRVRALDAQGRIAPVGEIRLQSSAGEFAADQGITPLRRGTSVPCASPVPGPPAARGPVGGALPLLGVGTEAQGGAVSGQVTERAAVATVRLSNGEAVFSLIAPNTPGSVKLQAETGDPEHRLTGSSEVVFLPETHSPILVGMSEMAFGHAAPEFGLYGQSGDWARRADVFLRAPFCENVLTVAYTSHLPINSVNGTGQMFQTDPLDRVYPVFGDSSTRFQTAQGNSRLYARFDSGLNYVRFGDLRGDSAAKGSFGMSNFDRNLTGVEAHVEDKAHGSLTLMGARPNSAYARDVFPASTYGLIQLSHQDILPGSETVVLESRDRYNPEIVLSREPLLRSTDYNFDWMTGAIFFLRSLNIFDQALNLNQVVVSYEYHTIGMTSSVYGIRSGTRFPKIGLSLDATATNQRSSGVGSYYLGGIEMKQTLPRSGSLRVEVPVSYGSGLAAGADSLGAPGASGDVNGAAVRAELKEPIGALNGVVEAAISKTDASFFNPFGATTTPGSQTSRGSLELSPSKGTQIKFGVMDERNKTSLVDNQRQTASFALSRSLAQGLTLKAGYDFRDLHDTQNARDNQAHELNAAIDWKITSRLRAMIRRDQNLTSSDPTYPNQTSLKGQYQVSEAVRLFATERLSSAPIVPIGDLSRTGFASLASRQETSIGIEDRWNRFASAQGRYQVENGINGVDSYAVIGLTNRIPVSEQVNVDLGLERGELITGKDKSFNGGSVGFAYLPSKRFKTSARYELRDNGNIGQILSAGAAGKLADGLTVLSSVQHSSASYLPATGPIGSSGVAQAATGTQGLAALALRPLKRDSEALLFSYTVRDSSVNAISTTLPTHDRIDMLSTDGYIQANRDLEFYGKFAFSDRRSEYGNSPWVSTGTYLWQGRAQTKLSRRFDAAIEGRIYNQPASSLFRATAAVEGGFWILRDFRLGLGYNLKSTDELGASFLSNRARRGVYFVMSTKLANLFDLFAAPVSNRASGQ